MSSDSTFIVAPSFWLVLWTIYILAVVVAAVITGLKGRYMWLLVGLLLAGLPLFYSAFLLPVRGSPWAGWASRRRKSPG